MKVERGAGRPFNLVECVTEFRAGLLGKRSDARMCFAVSSALAGYLHFLGQEAEVVHGSVGEHDHYWIELGDGRIIDATASQFKKPNGREMAQVYIGALPLWYKKQ